MMDAGFIERTAVSMQPTAWTSAAAIFFGGTQAALALKGRRVRTAAALNGFPIYDPVNPRSQRTVNLAAGCEGFVANAIDDRILVALSADPSKVPQSLEELMKFPLGGFIVVPLNWPTFRLQFSIQK
jgi:hypothetical protein